VAMQIVTPMYCQPKQRDRPPLSLLLLAMVGARTCRKVATRTSQRIISASRLTPDRRSVLRGP